MQTVSVIHAGPFYCVTLDGTTAIRFFDKAGRFPFLYERDELLPFIAERVDSYIEKLEAGTCDSSFAPPEAIRESRDLVVQALINAVAYQSPSRGGNTDSYERYVG